tara:strand:- start:797 stop:937 length:141 start_codon:yes stop_codon:yes gene_type:complete
MRKKNDISTRSEHKKQLRELRIKNLEKKLKSNIQKRKKNKKDNNNG